MLDFHYLLIMSGKILYSFIICLGLWSCNPQTNQDSKQDPVEAQERPNIIVIMADDQGQWASEVYGNQEVNTPNMLWLAQQGALFQQAYAISPVCSPTRASFFTGRMPSQHGVHDFLSESPKYDHDWLQQEVLLSTLLQDAGYNTGLIGKWHATTNSAQMQRGFNYWFSYDVAPAGWQNQYQHSGKVYFSENGAPSSYEGFQSHVLTDKAIQFMKPHQEDPFFLFLGFIDTHAPFEGQPDSLVANLRLKDLSSSINTDSAALPARSSANYIPDNHHEQLAQYYAGVEFMDVQIGRILNHLRAQGLMDNTLIIYTSDHGHMNGHHGLYGKGNATRPQNFYQESLLVPLTLTWPAHISEGLKFNQPVSTIDLYQTVLAAAKVNLNSEMIKSKNSPGKNVLQLIGDNKYSWGAYQYAELGNARMIANPKYKYIERYPPLVDSLTAEFYDLTADPLEKINVAQHPQYRDDLKSMKTELQRFFNLYQTPEHSGINLSQQPPANGNEQWRTP